MINPSNPYSRAVAPNYFAYSDSLRNPRKLTDEETARLEAKCDATIEGQERQHNIMLDQIEEESAYLYDHPELH